MIATAVVRTLIGSVALLVAALACGDSSAPSGVPPTSIRVEPSHLQLVVGDTGRVRLVLLAGTRTVEPESDGWLTWEGPGASSRIVATGWTPGMERISILGVAPGTDTWRFRYMKKTKCTDPPMCYGSHWYDYLQPQLLEVVVR